VFNHAAPRPHGSLALRIEVTGQRRLLQLTGKKRRRIFRENKEEEKLIHGTNTPPGARSSPASPQIDGGWALGWAARARAAVDASTRRPGGVDEACEPIARMRRGARARIRVHSGSGRDGGRPTKTRCWLHHASLGLGRVLRPWTTTSWSCSLQPSTVQASAVLACSGHVYRTAPSRPPSRQEFLRCDLLQTRWIHQS
jgi:hypothetical protein